MDDDFGDWVAQYLRELDFVQLDDRNIEFSLGLKINENGGQISTPQHQGHYQQYRWKSI